MLETLDNYYLLKEVVKETNTNIGFYSYKFKEDIIVLRHTRYIKRDCIEFRYRKKLTDLYGHIPLKEFAEYVTISRGVLESKVDFMKKHKNIELFEYREIDNTLYVVVDDELKRLLASNLTPFIISTNSEYTEKDVVASKYFANYCIGFYK